ncbi:MAG: RNase adapter RapZ [Desulfobacterales bacterium]|nr:RNase adapter RapZ [Desulfobacterales bacterium]
MKYNKIIIITGLSGSGKSSAMAAFEDAGFFCVDNMPVAMLPKFLEISAEDMHGKAGLVFVMDLREAGFLYRYQSTFEELGKKGYNFEIIFLEADEKTLLKRFNQSRRQHPLSYNSNLADAIKNEKEQLTLLRKDSDIIIDTSHYNIHKLKSVIRDIANKRVPSQTMRINIMSFGFKYDPPQNVDLLIDVRFLKNPYFVPELKNKSGENSEVFDYIFNDDITREFIKKYKDLIDFLIPHYENEGKSYLTIAIGCTGGRHRSVAVSRDLFEHIKKPNVSLNHRDINQ